MSTWTDTFSNEGLSVLNSRPIGEILLSRGRPLTWISEDSRDSEQASCVCQGDGEPTVVLMRCLVRPVHIYNLGVGSMNVTIHKICFHVLQIVPQVQFGGLIESTTTESSGAFQCGLPTRQKGPYQWQGKWWREGSQDCLLAHQIAECWIFSGAEHHAHPRYWLAQYSHWKCRASM